MGSDQEFGPDTETIRAWLAKRATYAKDARVIGAPRGAAAATTATGPSAGDAPAPAPAPAPVTPTLTGSANSTAAGRSVVDALHADVRPAAPPAARRSAVTTTATTTRTRRGATARVSAPRRHEVITPAPPAPPTGPAGPAVAAPSPSGASRWTEPEENLAALEASTDVDFPVRGGTRRALSVVLLAVLAATGATSYVAAQTREPLAIAVAGVLGFLTLMVWAVRAGCTTTELSIHRGQLSIRRAGRTEVVDLASDYTPIAIVGEPGHRRWTVLVERPGLPLVVIDARMVDAHWFTSALYRLRPELRPGQVGIEAPRDENVF